jgi:hypothetical protein
MLWSAGRVSRSWSTSGTCHVNLVTNLTIQIQVINEERTGKRLWQMEHIRRHLWHRYSRTVNKDLYRQVCNKINMTGATSRSGTTYSSGAPDFTPGFSGVRVTRSLVLCICFVDRCLSFCPSAISVYDKWNISVVICDTDIPELSTKPWWRPWNFRSDIYIYIIWKVHNDRFSLPFWYLQTLLIV